MYDLINHSAKTVVETISPEHVTDYEWLLQNVVLFTMPPKRQDFGGVLAQFVDFEGGHCSVGAEAA